MAPPKNRLCKSSSELGLYQIFLARTHPGPCRRHEPFNRQATWFSSQSRFINAPLGYPVKRTDQGAPQELKLRQPALGFSHPIGLVERWLQRWGEQRPAIAGMEQYAAPTTHGLIPTSPMPKHSRRVGRRKVSNSSRRMELVRRRLVFELTSIRLSQSGHFQRDSFMFRIPAHCWRCGNWTQSWRRTRSLRRPAGKTTFIAQRMQNTGHILAQDLSEPASIVCARTAAPRSDLCRIGRPLRPVPTNLHGTIRRSFG